jgi:hypothetical protein
VFSYDECAELEALPASWTDVDPTDPFVSFAAGPAYFRPADLLALPGLLARLREVSRDGEAEAEAESVHEISPGA